MLLTVEGIYTNGKVELAETPTGVKQARVLVTFLTDFSGFFAVLTIAGLILM